MDQNDEIADTGSSADQPANAVPQQLTPAPRSWLARCEILHSPAAVVCMYLMCGYGVTMAICDLSDFGDTGIFMVWAALAGMLPLAACVPLRRAGHVRLARTLRWAVVITLGLLAGIPLLAGIWILCFDGLSSLRHM